MQFSCSSRSLLARNLFSTRWLGFYHHRWEFVLRERGDVGVQFRAVFVGDRNLKFLLKPVPLHGTLPAGNAGAQGNVLLPFWLLVCCLRHTHTSYSLSYPYDE